jgi:hypothetical protein
VLFPAPLHEEQDLPEEVVPFTQIAQSLIPPTQIAQSVVRVPLQTKHSDEQPNIITSKAKVITIVFSVLIPMRSFFLVVL